MNLVITNYVTGQLKLNLFEFCCEIVTKSHQFATSRKWIGLTLLSLMSSGPAASVS